jgi:hypothetical protein
VPYNLWLLDELEYDQLSRNSISIIGVKVLHLFEGTATSVHSKRREIALKPGE